MTAESGTCWVVPYEAFWAATDTKTYEAFQDMPHTPTSEIPCIQHRHLGALIAPCIADAG